MNETVVDWCRQRGPEATRSRAYRKNDQRPIGVIDYTEPSTPDTVLAAKTEAGGRLLGLKLRVRANYLTPIPMHR
jgi:hypothetical protein